MSCELPRNMKELLRHFPRKIPKDICMEIDCQGKDNYIFCYNKEDKQKAACASCGKEIIIPINTYHNGECRCPKCNRTAQVKHIWRGIKSLEQSVLSYHYLKSQIDDDVIICMVVYTHYRYNGEQPWKNKPFRSIDAYYVFVPGKGAVYAADRCKMYSCGIASDNKNYRWGIEPYIRSIVKLRENAYHTMYGESTIDIITPNKYTLAQLIKTTSLKHCWEAYTDMIAQWRSFDRYIKLLEYMSRYPKAMEYLAKIGLDEALYDTIQEQTTTTIGAVFNMRGKTLDKITRRKLTKADKRYLLECRNKKATSITLSNIKLWQGLGKYPGGCNVSLQQAVEELNYIPTYHLIALQYVKVDKLLNYIKKQKEVSPDCHVDICIYADYIRSCIKLNADMKSKATLWPKDLIQMHNKQKVEIKALEKVQEENKYQKLRRKIEKKYSFEAMGFMIVVPDRVADLIREGTEMHNCVGGYIDRVANGDTCVVYIRKADALNESFGTMEIDKAGRRIIQARGKFNKDLPPEAQAFVKAFEEAKIKKHKRSKAA